MATALQATTRIVRERVATPRIIRHEPLPRGIHLAPFRDSKGRIAFVVIGENNQIDALWAIDAIDDGWFISVAPPTPRQGANVDGGNNGRPEDIEVHVDDTALASHPDLFKLYGVERWQVGVHVFPWGGRVYAANAMIAVVGFDGCVHAFMEVSEVNEETLKWPLTYLDELTWNQGTGVPTGAFDYSGQAEEEEEE